MQSGSEADSSEVIYRNKYLFVVQEKLGGMSYRIFIYTDLLEAPDDVITFVDTPEEAYEVVDALMLWDTKRIAQWNRCCSSDKC